MSLRVSAAEKVAGLVRLAVDAGASGEEARTAAYVACKIIVDNGLLPQLAAALGRAASAPSPPPWEPHSARRAWSEVRPDEERQGRAVRLVSRYAGRCRLCESAYRAGEEVRWRKGVGCVHAACGAEVEGWA